MQNFLVILFLFSVGSFFGWILELLFRRFLSKNNPERKWINPGFLVGPCLPLYGFSLIVLYLLSKIDLWFIENPIVKQISLFVVMSICITFLEFIAGLIFIKGMKIKLWDYSDCFGNIKGIICPQFSFYWIVLSALYYFLTIPRIISWVFWFTNHLAFSFFTGVYYGILIIDIIIILFKSIHNIRIIINHFKAFYFDSKVRIGFLAAKNYILKLFNDLHIVTNK